MRRCDISSRPAPGSCWRPLRADAARATQVPHAFLFVLLGYFGVHLFEHTVAPHFHFGEEVHPEALLRPSAGYLAVLGLGVHTLFDGVAIAAGFMISPRSASCCSSRCSCTRSRKGSRSPRSCSRAVTRARRRVGAAACSGVLTLVGARGDRRWSPQHHVGYALALSAGVTIYVAASDLIPEVNREGGPALGWTVFAGRACCFVADSASLSGVGLSH